MPVKTNKHISRKYPKDYAKVYWPYLPLILIVSTALWLGHPLVDRSQRSVLSYSTHVTASGLLSDSNQARQSSGHKLLNTNPKLDQAAQAKANDMVSRNYWAHLTPDGQAPWIFIDKSGYQYQKAGENLAYGFGNNSDVINGWLNSPAHKANLLDNDFSDVGFGIASSPNFQGTGPETVIVALYAEPGLPVVPTPNQQGVVAGFSTNNVIAHETDQSISKAQTLTGGRAPWITFAAGLIAGLALAYLLIKHSVSLHKTFRKGEKFVIKHPVVDVTIVAFIALCALLCQSVGLIR